MTCQLLAAACSFLLLGACNAGNGPAANTVADAPAVAAGAAPPQTSNGQPFAVSEIARFREPWAMAFLPDGRLLVTEKRGALRLLDPANAAGAEPGAISGVPEVDYGGQGGLGDVVLHPRFADNGVVYLSYAEAGDGDTRGAAVARARLTLDGNGGGALSGLEVIWRQVPKVGGRGHYGHRLAFAANGDLFISSGERQKFEIGRAHV